MSISAPERHAFDVMLEALYEAHDMIIAPEDEWRERVLDKIRNAISVATKSPRSSS